MKSTDKPAAGPKQPVPVLRLQFVDERQSVPGLTIATSCTSMLDPQYAGRSKHLIWYLPWLRAFWIEFYDRADSKGAVVDRGMVGEHRVMKWLPQESPAIPRG